MQEKYIPRIEWLMGMPWCRPEPRRDFFLSLAFAAQRGGSKMLREAGKRRRDRRAAGRYATGTRA